MRQRRKIGMNMSPGDIAVAMGEGNPGALNVVMRMIAASPMGLLDLLHLDDMNMRGSQIWVGYKEHCGEDLKKYIESVKARDPELVATVNRFSGIDECAVISGASFK